MLCFSNGMCFIELTPLFSESPCSVVHFCNKGCAELLVLGIPAQDHLVIQFRQCEEEAFSVTLSDLAENDDIRLIRVAILISKANSYLMLNEQMIGVIVRNIDESIIAVHQ